MHNDLTKRTLNDYNGEVNDNKQENQQNPKYKTLGKQSNFKNKKVEWGAQWSQQFHF